MQSVTTGRLVRRALVFLFLFTTLVKASPASPEAKRVRASYYAAKFAGRKTSTGERYDPYKLTCAHRTLKLGTHLLITNPSTGRSVTVVVNDRGPWVSKFGLDLSWSAAQALGITRQLGWAWVTYKEINVDTKPVEFD